MRIAISGTHGIGKSTLIDEFLLTHRDFVHEPEAYEVLQDEYGETFAAVPSAEDFQSQLDCNVDQLARYHSGDKVIFERSPVDYLAYLLAWADLRRDQDASRLADQVLETVGTAILNLDLIVLLTTTDKPTNTEKRKLRAVVSEVLENILINNEFDLFISPRPLVIEAAGTTAHRLHILERALNKNN